jgi:hypothetical protein
MQSRLWASALAVGLVTTAGCSGQHVATDASPSTNFSQFRTFSLVSPPDSASTNMLLDERVRSAVDSGLKAKGLREIPRDSADLYVGYGIVDRTHKEVYTTGWGWGGGWGWGAYRWGAAWPVDLQTSVDTYTDGTVVMWMVDAKTKKLVWKGQVGDALSLPVKDPAKATQSIDEAVAKMLAKYPSGAAA